MGYGAIVRDLFTNGMGGRALDLVAPKAIPFVNAMTTALITCFELGRAPGDVAIKLVAEPTDLDRLEAGRIMTTSDMAEQRRWSRLFVIPLASLTRAGSLVTSPGFTAGS